MKDYKRYGKEEFLTAKDVVEALKKRVRLIIASILTFTFITAVFVFFISTPKYEASVKLFAGKTEEVQSDYSDKKLESYSSIINTYIELIKTRDFMNKIIDEVNLDTTPKALMNSLQFITKANTPIIEIRYVSSNPEVAEAVISAITENFEVSVKEVILNTYTKVVDSVEVSELSQGRAAKIVLGGFIGLLISFGIVFLLELLDDTVSKKGELEKVLSIPILGQVPLLEDENNNPTPSFIEAYRVIRTRVEYSSVDKKLKTLMITSADIADGKSSVSLNLASALSQGGKRVVIVDCDLRKPRIHMKLKLTNNKGLTDYLIGKIKLNEAISKVNNNLDVITAGNRATNPAEIIGSKAMEQFINELNEIYDYVIIDTPSIKNINDGLALASKCDGVIYVVRAGKTKKDDIIDGYRELERVNANVIGSILNGVCDSKDNYYY